VEITGVKREKILLVDDDPFSNFFLREVLANEYQVEIATSGQEALARVHSADKPDLILLDVLMPGMDGFEVCRNLRRDPATRDIPVIFVTSKGGAEDEPLGFELGCVDYLIKPTSAAIVRARVGSHLALASQNRHLERKVRERTQELAMAEEQWRLLLELAPDAMILADQDGRIQMVNAQTIETFGYAREELIGQPIGLLVPKQAQGGHAGQMASFLRNPSSRSMGLGLDLAGRRKDGTEFPIDVSLGVLPAPHGTRVLAFVRDITARKEAEAESQRSEAQLRHAQHMEAIGEMAAGIAHEINTPTQYIGDNTIFLRDEVKELLAFLAAERDSLERSVASSMGNPSPEWAGLKERFKNLDLDFLSEEIPKSIHQILEGLARIAKIVGAMKDFSHPGTETKVPTDLNRAIETTLTISRSAWKYVAAMETDLDPDLPMVPCFPGEFSQAVLNLVVNAAHAIEEKLAGQPTGTLGTIRVSTRRVEHQVEVRVSDTGVGIPEEIRARIFDPFFTTKPIGRGTGQGLAIAHSVVVGKLGGSIGLESEVGRGTSFILRLPLSPASTMGGNGD